MYPADKKYIQTLARGLHLSSLAPLDIVMGPNELKKLLQSTSVHDFCGANPWINLHTHSSASDGQLSPEQWVANIIKWTQDNHLMYYVIALTDHDTLDGLVPVLKYVVKNYKKLKGIRIVLGCELSTAFESQYTRRPVDFEILHYGINPFDTAYTKLLKEQSATRKKQLPLLFQKINEKYPWIPATWDGFCHSSFYGPNVKKGLGVNWVYNTMLYFQSLMPPHTDSSAILDDVLDFGFQQKPMWYSPQQLLDFTRKNGGFTSMAHPYRLQLDQRLNTNADTFIPHFFETLAAQGLDATELRYGKMRSMLAAFQAMTEGYSPANDTDHWIKLIQNTSHTYFAYESGGADNHYAYLGNEQYHESYDAWLSLIEYWHQIQPLIDKGYRLLGKEVSMGLPGPCMPPFDIHCDTGIGSPYGLGAKRVWDFWGKTVHKILLGPSGQTTKEAKHSPYVSDDEHPNPFFITPEFLLENKLVTPKQLTEYFIKTPITDTIFFDQVETNFRALFNLLPKQNCDLINKLATKIKMDNKYPYIADMQVQIPKPIVDKHPDLFLPDFTLGTPPDAISDKPRNWGFPVFNPDKLWDKKGDLGPAGKLWQHIIDMAIAGAHGGLRIDHFIGMVNPYLISKDPHIPNGRLYSSYDHPILKKYALTKPDQFYRVIEKIVMPILKKHHLKIYDLYPEDIGARPEQLDDVLNHFNLGRLVVAEFVEPNNPDHMYQLMKTQPNDVATLDTHDTPSIQMFFDGLNDADRYAHAQKLAKSLRFNYNDSLKSTEQLVRMQWAELFTCPAKRVQAFFTSWSGQIGRYNQPGNPNKWQLRCAADFDQLYFKNLYHGRAYNPLDAIALAIYARGDKYYQKNEKFVAQLRQAEKNLFNLIQNWLK